MRFNHADPFDEATMAMCRAIRLGISLHEIQALIAESGDPPRRPARLRDCFEHELVRFTKATKELMKVRNNGREIAR